MAAAVAAEAVAASQADAAPVAVDKVQAVQAAVPEAAVPDQPAAVNKRVNKNRRYESALQVNQPQSGSALSVVLFLATYHV